SSLTAVPLQTVAKRWSFETGVPAWVTSSFSTAAAFGVSRTSRSPDQSLAVATSNLNCSPKRTSLSIGAEPLFAIDPGEIPANFLRAPGTSAVRAAYHDTHPA